MKQITTYVGIDAHKKDLFVAMLIGTSATPVTWTVANEPNAVRRLVRKLEREAPGLVQACYEAGPCGYALQLSMRDGLTGEASAAFCPLTLIASLAVGRSRTARTTKQPDDDSDLNLGFAIERIAPKKC